MRQMPVSERSFLNSMVVSVHREAEPLVESITTVQLILQIYI